MASPCVRSRPGGGCPAYEHFGTVYISQLLNLKASFGVQMIVGCDFFLKF